MDWIEELDWIKLNLIELIVHWIITTNGAALYIPSLNSI